MNCREAERAIILRGLEPLAPEGEAALRRHLEVCDACAAEERAERCLRDDLASLRGECPLPIDIGRRVMREIAVTGRVERELVPARQIGWAAAAAVACLVGLLGSLPWFWPRLSPLLAGLETTAVTFGRIAADLAAPLLTLLTLPLKLAMALVSTLSGLTSLLSSLEPAAVGTIAVCYLAMATTITLVVGRDLRKAGHAMSDREE